MKKTLNEADYVEGIARACWEANRAIVAQEFGEDVVLPWKDTSDEQRKDYCEGVINYIVYPERGMNMPDTRNNLVFKAVVDLLKGDFRVRGHYPGDKAAHDKMVNGMLDLLRGL